MELCPSCFLEHAKSCLFPDIEYREAEEEEGRGIPTECPECGCELELDYEPTTDTSVLYCTRKECSYTLDVSRELREFGWEDYEEEEDEDLKSGRGGNPFV